MHLYIVRHGIAIDREDPNCPPEAERFLTEKGIEKTRAAARGLKKLGIAPTALFTSPYLRAVQTGEIVCDALELRPNKLKRTDTLLPEAEPTEFFRELRRTQAQEVMCFGHGPNVDLLVAHSLATSHMATEMKKAGVACLDVGSPPGRGKLLWLATPKMLRLMGE